MSEERKCLKILLKTVGFLWQGFIRLCFFLGTTSVTDTVRVVF